MLIIDTILYRQMGYHVQFEKFVKLLYSSNSIELKIVYICRLIFH